MNAHQPRRGLGRGLGSLIPTAPTQHRDESAPTTGSAGTNGTAAPAAPTTYFSTTVPALAPTRSCRPGRALHRNGGGDIHCDRLELKP